MKVLFCFLFLFIIISTKWTEDSLLLYTKTNINTINPKGHSFLLIDPDNYLSSSEKEKINEKMQFLYNYKKIYIGSDVVPSSDSSQTLGGEDNQWSAVWANEVYCDEIYTDSARLPHARLSSGVINQLNATYEVPLGSIISVRLRVNSTFGIPSKDILIPIGTEFDIVTYASGTFPYSIFSYTEGENVVKMSLYILTIDTSSQSYVDKACTLTEGKYVAFNNIIFSSSTAETSTYDVIIQRVQ